jgi:hypothetical protein
VYNQESHLLKCKRVEGKSFEALSEYGTRRRITHSIFGFDSKSRKGKFKIYIE